MGNGIRKVAVSFSAVEPLQEQQGIIRTASAKIQLEESSEASKMIKAEIEKHPNALFFRAKAIQADEVNSNGDYFSESELIRSAQTFVGVPFYTNHNNQDIENARGKIIWSEWDPKLKAIYVIGFVDREAYPHICRGIEEEYMTGVSMGCQVEYSVCSICHNAASTVDEYCPHVKNLKGRKFSGRVKDAKTGEIRMAKNEKVYEDNYGIRFIELSGVGDPACKSCRIQGVFDNDSELKALDNTLAKAASISNSLYMYRESSLYKDAGQQEIDQLNQALQSIEEICKNLITNRKNVEVEFAADLVEILANLQKFTDELVGAGYGQLQQGQIPGVEGDVGPSPVPQDDPMSPVQPVSQSAPAPGLGAGAVSGSPGSSLVSSPSMPTPPIKPMASQNVAESVMRRMSGDVNKLMHIAEKIASNATEEEQMRRRTPGIASKEGEQVKQGLNESWQEKQTLSEYTQQTKPNAVSANADNRGETMKQEAQRREAPDQITERQLDENFRYHQRTNEERNETTESQLAGKARKDDAPTSTTEKQIEGERTEVVQDQVTQKQLEKGGPKDPQSSRIEAEWDEVTQARLDKQRVNNEPTSVIEKQLEDKSSIWSRASFKRTEIKTAKDHVKDVLRVLAETSIALSVTPAQAHEAVSSMVDSIRSKTDLLDAITNENAVASEPRGLDISARAKYYGDKGIRLASVSEKDVKQAISSGLRTLIASDVKTHPEDVVIVLETLSEDASSSVKAIASAIDARIASAKTEDVSSNRKKAFRDALAQDDALLQRKAERQEVDKVVAKNSHTHIIEASFSEVGLTKGMGKEAAKARIVGFTQGVSATHNKKLAGITNVNVDGEKIQIAVQWDADGDSQSVELSMPGDEDKDLAPEAPAPEGDATGAGLDDLKAPALSAPGAEQAPLPALASAKGKIERTAQSPTGGGIPNAPAGGGMDPMSTGVPAPAPAEQGIQSLTEEPPAAEDGAPAEKSNQNPPGSICPFCGSDDVDVGGKALAAGACNCNGCGAVYKLSVNVEVLNPQELTFKGGEDDEAESPEVPESPDLPSMPVAAEVSLDKGAIQKMAELEKTHGHVCPSCGTKEIKALASNGGATEYVCPVCSTKTKKELLANIKDPSKAMMRVAWSVSPKKAVAAGCDTCKEAALKLVADVKVAKMIKAAQTTKFPMANCMERIARRHGLNAAATSGPCKGKPLADCVCKELQQFAITSTKKLAKLADAMMQPDDMDECLKDHVEKGYTKEASQHICGTLKKIYASEVDDNIFLLAWADEKDLTAEDLQVMHEKRAQIDNMPLTDDLDGDIGDALPEEAPLDPAVTEDVAETVTVEIPKDVAEDIADQVGSQSAGAEIEPPAAPEAPEPVVPEVDPTAQPALAKGKIQMKKEANKPTLVEDIEGSIEAGIPRGKATIGNEGKDNIDVTEKKLDVPGSKDKKSDLPEIPTGKATMGDEAKMQKDMPGTSTDIKGTVIAKGEGVQKVAKTPGHVENVETEVDAGIPRGTATLGNESADNIDKPMAKPEVPRGTATLGNEGADNIDVAEKKLDVPTGNQFLGHEQEVQSGMPALDVKEKGTVIAEGNRQKHLQKIEQARWKKAVSLAGRLLSAGAIEDQAFDDVVDVLSRVGLDQMETYASRMFPKKAVLKQASTMAPLATAIVQQASELELPKAEEPANAFADLFTIGSKGLDENLKRFGEK